VCTLTAVPTTTGVRVAFNRDELRSRPAGLPPAVRRSDGRDAVYPTDPASGGTWLAATDVGLVLAVLNVNRSGSAPGGRVSRGTVIPAVLAARSPAAAVRAVERDVRGGAFAPFRFVAIDRDLVADLVWGRPGSRSSGRACSAASRWCSPRPGSGTTG
jgi:uncharacterized protein with NRDE domain